MTTPPSTYGLNPDGTPTPMARIPTTEAFNNLPATTLAGLTIEQAIEQLWDGWQVRWTLVRDVALPTNAARARATGMDTREGTGLLLSHHREPWWAVVSVWTGPVLGGLSQDHWTDRTPAARRWSLGHTISGTGITAPTAEWASTLTDLITCTRARVRHDRSYAPDIAAFPLDEVLDTTPTSAVPEIDAARLLATLRT